MPLPSLTRFFPTPRYIEPSALGLDISDRSLKFAELVYSNNHLELGKFGSRVISEGLISSGEIKDKKGLIDFLKTNLEEFQGREIVLALPEEKAFLELVTLPVIKDANIHDVLEMQIEEHVPLLAQDAIFDYEIIPSPGIKDHMDTVLVAFPKNLVEDYRDVLRGAGLKPYVFEMETQALVRAILPKDIEDTVMVMDFGRTRTSFAIVSGGIVRFTSTVSVAGAALDQALATALKTDIFVAERTKKERGFIRTKENQDTFNILLPVISAIRDEIFRHLKFWQDHAAHVHNSKPEVSKLYLCGGESNLKGLAEYLSYDLKLPVTESNPWVNITSFEEYIPPITASQSVSYATALGLALRSANLS